jgi:hypothetical protein
MVWVSHRVGRNWRIGSRVPWWIGLPGLILVGSIVLVAWLLWVGVWLLASVGGLVVAAWRARHDGRLT